VSFRDGPFSDIKVPLTWAAGGAVLLALIAAIVLLMSDRRETLEEQAYGQIRATADSIQAPVSGALSAPVGWFRGGIAGVRGYFFAVSDNRRLRAENKELRQATDALAAERDVNDRLRALLKLRTEPPIPMVSGRSITDARGPFANSRLINVGRDAGLKVGYPVMSENGLVGRVVGVSGSVSRVLLLTDIASRTPVMIDRNNARAILSGDGGPNPKLDYMRSREQPKVGDKLVTSGDGGVMPRGLPVGVVVKGADGAWRAQLSSDRAPIDFVRILKFDDFSQLAVEQELSAPVTPEQMGGAIPQPVIPLKVVAPQPAPGAALKAAPAGTLVAPAPPLKAAPTLTPKAAPAPKTAAPKTAAPQTPAPKAAPAAAKLPSTSPIAKSAPPTAAPAVKTAPAGTAAAPKAPAPTPAASGPRTAPITSSAPKGVPVPPARAPAAVAPAPSATLPAAKAPTPQTPAPKTPVAKAPAIKGPTTKSAAGITYRKVQTPAPKTPAPKAPPPPEEAPE